MCNIKNCLGFSAKLKHPLVEKNHDITSLKFPVAKIH